MNTHFKHDETYKQLFSFPTTIKDLLTGHIKEDWITDLDFDRLERINGSYISDDLHRRESDVIWRLPFKDKGWLYVYVLLEFQSRVDKFMALRLLTYTCLLYQDLIKQKHLLESGKLPPVLPIVLYNGENRWQAPTQMQALIEPISDSPSPYLPSMQYYLLDEGAIISNPNYSQDLQNIVSALFQLEFADSPQAVYQVIEILLQYRQTAQDEPVLQAFVQYIKYMMRHAKWQDEASKVVWEQVNNLKEVQNMLAERVNRWPDKWVEKGMQQGMQQGHEKAQVDIAKRSLQQGLPLSTIAIITGLTIAQLERLQKEQSS